MICKDIEDIFFLREDSDILDRLGLCELYRLFDIFTHFLPFHVSPLSLSLSSFLCSFHVKWIWFPASIGVWSCWW